MGLRVLVWGWVACSLSIFAATSCVGDDPATGDVTAADAATNDASTAPDASTNQDASVADAGAPKCDVNKPFGAPTRITDLDKTGTENYLRLSPDGLTAYFSAVQDGGYSDAGESNDLKDIYRSTRSSIVGAFASPVALTAINSVSFDDVPSVTGDGLTIYFNSDRAGGLGINDIYFATRSSTIADFGAALPVAGINTVQSEGAPFVREDGQVLYFAKLVAASKHNIYRATRLGAGGFSGPLAVTELNVADEQYAAVTPDDLVVYYGSARTDGSPKGSFDVWIATRASTTDPFSNARNVAEVNSTDYDLPTFITADRCTLYLTRRILNDAGVEQSKAMFVATKSP
jgi:Tol biopolymer transport system component